MMNLKDSMNNTVLKNGIVTALEKQRIVEAALTNKKKERHFSLAPALSFAFITCFLLVVGLSIFNTSFFSNGATPHKSASITESEVQEYMNKHSIVPLLTETLPNQVIILSQNRIDSISKNPAGEIVSNLISTSNNDGAVKNGMIMGDFPYVYVVINFIRLLNNGFVLEVTFADGKTVSQPITDARGYLAFYDKNAEKTIKINNGCTVVIKDKNNNIISRENVEAYSQNQ